MPLTDLAVLHLNGLLHAVCSDVIGQIIQVPASISPGHEIGMLGYPGPSVGVQTGPIPGSELLRAEVVTGGHATSVAGCAQDATFSIGLVTLWR